MEGMKKCLNDGNFEIIKIIMKKRNVEKEEDPDLYQFSLNEKKIYEITMKICGKEYDFDLMVEKSISQINGEYSEICEATLKYKDVEIGEYRRVIENLNESEDSDLPFLESLVNLLY